MYDFDDYYNLLGRYSADQKQDCGLLMGASRMARHHTIALSRTWLMNVNLVSRGHQSLPMSCPHALLYCCGILGAFVFTKLNPLAI